MGIWTPNGEETIIRIFSDLDMDSIWDSCLFGGSSVGPY